MQQQQRQQRQWTPEAEEAQVEALADALEALSVGDPRRQTLLQQQPQAYVEKALKIIERRSSVLKDRGQTAVLRDAAQDGSSFLCVRCEGLIAVARREFHQEWCPAALPLPSVTSSSPAQVHMDIEND